MTVLIVSEPGVDGVFRYVDGLCRYLTGCGTAVHLAYSDRRGSDRLFRLVAHVVEHGGATLNLRTGNRPAAADGPALVALARLTRAVRPDVIHSHSSKAGALARPLVLAGCPAVQVYQPHAYVGMRPRGGRWDGAYNAVERVLGRIAYTITCSTGERSFAVQRLKIPAERIFHVPHCVDTDVFRPASQAEKFGLRKAFGLPPSARVLGFMGRSTAQKDPRTLYLAFARAAANDPSLALFHVGKGELDPALDALARELRLADRIFRRPYLSTPAEFYRVVDGAVLPSRYEGFSLVALEALAADLPLILSDAAGNADLLAEPLSHAWKASPGDVAGFADGIAAWARDLDARRPINHRELARTRYRNPRHYETILGLYRSWVKRSSLRR